MSNIDKKLIEKLKQDKTVLPVNNEVVIMSAKALRDYLREILEKAENKYKKGSCIEAYFANEQGFFHVDGYKFYKGYFDANYYDGYCVIATDRCLIGVLLSETFEGESLVDRLSYAMLVSGVSIEHADLDDGINQFIKKRKKFLDM